ncbi:hypothetical protein VM98_35000, partial [Streptomyces rubellomurinus subsp. indigoferus]
ARCRPSRGRWARWRSRAGARAVGQDCRAQQRGGVADRPDGAEALVLVVERVDVALLELCDEPGAFDPSALLLPAVLANRAGARP